MGSIQHVHIKALIGGKDLNASVSPKQFEELNLDLVLKAMALVDKCFNSVSDMLGKNEVCNRVRNNIHTFSTGGNLRCLTVFLAT